MKPKVHLLFVDDENDNTAILKIKFRKEIKEGTIKISFANSADEGLEILRKTYAKGMLVFLVTDINMPAKSGFYMAETVKKRYDDVFLYFCSAYDRQDYMDQAKELGAKRFFTKPMKIEEIKKILKDDANTITGSLD